MTEQTCYRWRNDYGGVKVSQAAKTVIVVKDTQGFIVNYLHLPFRLNAIWKLEMGIATREEIDAGAISGLGSPVRPPTLQDLVGVDVSHAAYMPIYEETKDCFPAILMKKTISADRLQWNISKEFYKHKNED